MRLYLTLGMLALVVAAGAAAIGVAAAPTTLKDFSFLGTGRTTAEGPRLHTYGQCTLADVEGRHGFKTGRSWEYLYTESGEPPPLGMRSAVPLGGFGVGSIELRADGSFHDYLLENQGPGLIHSEHKSSLWPTVARWQECQARAAAGNASGGSGGSYGCWWQWNCSGDDSANHTTSRASAGR